MLVQQSDENLSRIARVITDGGVIAFRTDTFYGLGADPLNPAGVQKVKDLKGREEAKPILVLISDADQITRLIERPSVTFNQLAKRYWPGPLTIIGAATRQLPNSLTAGTDTVGVRLPDDDRVRALIRACGGALTATSANVSGEPAARTAAEVATYFGERIDLIVDGGAVKTDQPSTVVDATTDELKVVREGVIRWSDILAALGKA